MCVIKGVKQPLFKRPIYLFYLTEGETSHSSGVRTIGQSEEPRRNATATASLMTTFLWNDWFQLYDLLCAYTLFCTDSLTCWKTQYSITAFVIINCSEILHHLAQDVLSYIRTHKIMQTCMMYACK